MIGIRLSAAVRLEYVAALFSQPVSAVDKMSKGSPTDIITNSANMIQIGVSDKLAILIQSVSLVVTAYIVAFKYSWQLTLASSSCLLFIAVVYSFIAPAFIKLQHKMDKADEKASGIASDVFGSIRTVFSLGAEDQLTLKYNKFTREAQRRSRRISPMVGLLISPALFATYCNFALSFWFGIKLYSWGQIDGIGTLIIAFFSVMLTVSVLGNIAAPIIQIFKSASAATQFFKVIDAPRLTQGGLKAPDISVNTSIMFKDVVFAYPSRPTIKILDEMNLHFEVGKTTALVGPSGCGKSTIVGLLERWYSLSEINEKIEEPNAKEDESKGTKKPGKFSALFKKKNSSEFEIKSDRGSDSDDNEEKPIIMNAGSVLLGDTDIERLDTRWWRSQIGLVQQEPFLFNETIHTNIAYGLIGSKWENTDATVQRELIEDACKEAFADEFVRKLPQVSTILHEIDITKYLKGYDTRVGEGGIKLSGGQRQRIAIARSIVGKPSILILDEATSAIDVRGERIVQAALDRVSKDRTTIVIAHRLSTIKKADKIIVLREGKAVEEGTHESLLANQGGIYHNLVRAQHLNVVPGQEEEEEEDIDLIQEDPTTTLELQKTKSARSAMDEEAAIATGYPPGYKEKGIFGSLGLLIWEQRSRYVTYLLIIVCGMIAGSAFPLQSYIFAKIVAVFQETGPALLAAGSFWAAMFFALSIAVGISYFGIGYATNSVAEHVSYTYKREYFQNILHKSIAFYDAEENSSGSLTSRLTSDPKAIHELLGPNLTFPAIGVFNIIGSVTLCFVFGWKLTLVVLCSATPLIIAAGFIRLRLEHGFTKASNKVFKESAQFAAETIKAIRTVFSLTLEQTILDRYKTLLDHHVRDAFKRAWKASFVFALADSIELPCSALAFWYGGQLLATREYDVVAYLIIYMSILMTAQITGQYLAISPNVSQATGAANRVLSLRETARQSENFDSSLKAGDLPSTGALSIEIEDLRFRYPTRPAAIFKSLNLSIPGGSFVALVGPSGCGKSTTISLLERFYEPTSGTISMNGIDISKLPVRQYRKHLSLVSQEPTLFQGTVRENLVLGLDREISDTEVHQACIDAEIHTFILSLPQSYATTLSGASHGSLSGGQKQRLCIARALLRQPQLLLLDEATSSLDSLSESLVQAALEKLAAKRDITIVVVAHRLATVQKADCIFVMGDGGEILERGRHEELIERRGVYASMCRAQALDR